jgi:hypothetical protein
METSHCGTESVTSQKSELEFSEGSWKLGMWGDLSFLSFAMRLFCWSWFGIGELI